MDDLISRQAAINAYGDWYVEEGTAEGFIGTVKQLLEGLPSADRPQGEWIEIGTISHSYKCSVCGRTIFHTTVGKSHVAKYYPYCHCGADMRKEKNNGIR